MARIIAGRVGSLSLEIPKSHTRPTSERVREAIFSALESRGVIEGARVLDLYAGSGALGLEALSRGALELTAVESQQSVCAVLTRNAQKISAALGHHQPSVVCRSVTSFLSQGAGNRYDLVFIDPPYTTASTEVVEVLQGLKAVVAEDAVVVLERSSRDANPAWPDGYYVVSTRDYGDTRVLTFELSR